MLWSGQYLAYMTWLPLYLVEEQGLPVESAIGGYLIPVALVGVFNLTTGYLLQRGWRAQRLLCGAVTVQAAVWWLLPAKVGRASCRESVCQYVSVSVVAGYL